MKVFEIFSQDSEDKSQDFDLHDDLIFFMKSDSDFYRSNLFPIESRLQDKLESDEKTTPAIFKEVVKKAYKIYKDKFSVDHLDEELSMEDLKEICTKLYSEHVNEFKEKQANKEK